MNRLKKASASLVIASMALTLIPFNVLAESGYPTRISGYTAAQTAVQIAEQTGWTGTAILASSASYGMVDALTAGPLATFLQAPILLTETGNVLNADTEAELTKLKVKTVYVTSGTGVINQAVLDRLTGLDITVVPLGGSDRFATATNIANKMVELGATVNKVAVAYGWKNQDALSIAAIASAQTEPILLTETDSIPASVKEFLSTHTSVIATDVIGGTGVISDSVKAQFPGATRHYGNTAYDTNLAVLKAFDSVLKYDHAYIANGETAIDALAGAPLAAKFHAGIVLANGVGNEGTKYVSSKLSETSVVTALGGTAVVPDVVQTDMDYNVPVVSVAPVVPVVPVIAGGGGGGPIAPVVTMANVSSEGELTTALANDSITTINLTASFSASPTITRSLTMNFGDYTLTGDLVFNHTGTGTSVLTGNGGDRITGDLSVNTPKASFDNGVLVHGAVNVENVKIGTWTESANGNTLTITDSDGASVTVTGHPGSVTVTTGAGGTLSLTVNAGATVSSIISNAPISIEVVEGATVDSITAGTGAGGTTITNNGTTGTVTANVPINLVANVAPANTVTGAEGSVVVSGTNAVGIVVVPNLTAYNAALAAVNTVAYTPASWAAYQLVVAANVVTVSNTQAEVTAAIAAITAAQGNLVTVLAVGPVTPVAPTVTADDTTNTVTGMAVGMEYNLDGASYVAYNTTTFGAINFSGEHTLLVRVAAEGLNPFGPDTTLVFTTNPPTPVTPDAPAVTANDTANTVSGMAVGMEYNLDGTGFVPYVATTFAAINLSGEHTLLVRVAAEGINPYSSDTTLTFTTNQATLVTGISLNKTSTTVLVGGNETLIATILPAGATNKDLIWTSSTPTIATVDSNGTVLGGTNASTFAATTITAKTVDGNKTATCSVRVMTEAMVVSDINIGTAANMALKLAQYTILLGLDLTVYNAILPLDRTQVHGALAAATFTTMAQIKPAFDTAVAIQVAIQEINASSLDTVGAALTKNATLCDVVLTDYNALTNKLPVHTALKLKSIVSAAELKKTLNESVAIEEINSATVDTIGAVITKNATTLTLVLTDYNALANKGTVHQAMDTKVYTTALDVRTAFNIAVAVQAINEATSATMDAAIKKYLPILGQFQLSSYNALVNKIPVHTAMETPTFTTASEVVATFNAAVAIQVINAATVTTMGATITSNATVLGLSLTTYNSLVNKGPIYTAMEAVTFTTVAEVQVAFDEAVLAQKSIETP